MQVLHHIEIVFSPILAFGFGLVQSSILFQLDQTGTKYYLINKKRLALEFPFSFCPRQVLSSHTYFFSLMHLHSLVPKYLLSYHILSLNCVDWGMGLWSSSWSWCHTAINSAASRINWFCLGREALY